jgi:PHD/YefM family antitoxin component YafN of YafNO toxin-antitoxin module
MNIHPQYITDTVGKKLVVLPLKEFKNLMEDVEELEDIKAYDKAMKRKQEFIPLDTVISNINKSRKEKK